VKRKSTNDKQRSTTHTHERKDGVTNVHIYCVIPNFSCVR
jgi:hypothetical protein